MPCLFLLLLALQPAPPGAPQPVSSASAPLPVSSASAPLATTGSLAGLAVLASGALPKQKEATNSVDVETCGTSLRWRPLQVGRKGELAGVVIEATPDDAAAGSARTPPPAPATLVVELRDCGQFPGVLVVPVGSRVELRNIDGLAHDIVSTAVINPPFQQPLPRYRRRLTVPPDCLARPERITLSCSRHTTMASRWVVSDNPFVTVTGEDGRFRIDDLPAGRWRISAWHGELGTAETTVEVTAGTVAPVSLSLR